MAQREPPIIADVATGMPAGAVFFDSAEGRVLLETPPADAPRGTFEPVGLIEAAEDFKAQPWRPNWGTIGVIAFCFGILALVIYGAAH